MKNIMFPFMLFTSILMFVAGQTSKDVTITQPLGEYRYDFGQCDKYLTTLMDQMWVRDPHCGNHTPDYTKRIINMYEFHQGVRWLVSHYKPNSNDWCQVRDVVDPRLAGDLKGCWSVNDLEGTMCRGEPLPLLDIKTECHTYCRTYQMTSCTYEGQYYKYNCPVVPMTDRLKTKFLDSVARLNGFTSWDVSYAVPFNYLLRAKDYVYWQPNPGHVRSLKRYADPPLGWPEDEPWIPPIKPSWRYNSASNTIEIL